MTLYNVRAPTSCIATFVLQTVCPSGVPGLPILPAIQAATAAAGLEPVAATRTVSTSAQTTVPAS